MSPGGPAPTLMKWTSVQIAIRIVDKERFSVGCEDERILGVQSMAPAAQRTRLEADLHIGSGVDERAVQDGDADAAKDLGRRQVRGSPRLDRRRGAPQERKHRFIRLGLDFPLLGPARKR